MPCAAVRLCSAIDSPLPPICRRPSARGVLLQAFGFFYCGGLRFRFRTKTPTHIKGASDHERLQIRNPSGFTSARNKADSGFPCGPHLSNHFLCIPRFPPMPPLVSTLSDAGNIYGRLTNSTQDVLEKRIAALEGGRGCVGRRLGRRRHRVRHRGACAEGRPYRRPEHDLRRHLHLLAHTLPAYGIKTTFVDAHDLAAVESAIGPDTRAVFLGNARQSPFRHSRYPMPSPNRA